SVLIIAALTIGLAADVRTGFHGQALISAGIWALLLYLLAQFEQVERRALLSCLVIATAGEIFLSLGWGLYTYRLHNIPLFVPPGHVLLLMLGITMAQRISRRTADAILCCAAVYALAAAAMGIDTFALPLLAALALISLLMPNHRPLYASTFIVSLVLELYGTWLGSWTWAREVPVIALVTTNPPGVASAFYAVLDALVAVTALLLARRLKEPVIRQTDEARGVEPDAIAVRD
ncbi:MAG: hypothetical protein ACXWCX_15110, partial [Burkholderiales bacterium]